METLNKFSWKLALKPLPILVALILFVLDQVTKYFVIHYIEMGEQLRVAPFLNFVHTKNKGAAFGMFRDASPLMRVIIFGIVTILCLYMLIYWLGTSPLSERIQRLSLAFILGGALGNLCDRIVLGEVTDFIDVYYLHYHFWIFNIADSAITIGVVLMGIAMLQQRRKSSS